MKTSSRRLLAVLLVALAGCAPRTSPTEMLTRASTDAHQGAAARTLALAGFHAYLVQADAAQAQRRFDEALQKDRAEPYALYGQLLLAHRRGHPERALAAALDLCEHAPRHPLAAAAARYALEASETAGPLDEQLLQRAGPALAAGLAGDAALVLRAAVARLQANRGEDEGAARTLAQMGVPDRVTLLGPFSAHQLLSLDELTPPEKDASFAGPFQGPFGELAARELPLVEGRASIEGELSDAGSYVLGVDLDVPESAVHVVRPVSYASYKVYLDGTLLLENRAFEKVAPNIAAGAVKLERGRHRLVIKLMRDGGASSITLSVPRLDGRPSGLRFSPAQGPAPAPQVPAREPAAGFFPTAQSLADALRPEVGDALAQFIAARDALGRDHDGAKRLVAGLAGVLEGTALTSLRAEVALSDRTVPRKVSRGRATRDLEATLEKDPSDVNALLARARVLLEEERAAQAAELVKKVRAAPGPVGYPVAMMDARAQLALGVEAQAEQGAAEALRLQPGLCEALELRYDLARRRDAVARADKLIQELETCPGGIGRTAEHSRLRGDVAGAARLYERLVERWPASIKLTSTLADLYVSLRRFDDALGVLRRLSGLWPRDAQLLRQRADVAELSGDAAGALRLREAALALDGGDLQLRRTVERARTGKELLADQAIDGKAAIAAYEARRGPEDSASTFILDAAAFRVYPDGSMVDRVHVIQKALDQSGVADIAEVSIPPGAQVLALRTIKADGAVLEPESIANKDSVSLPGVQVGDYVEYEYLLAHSSRGPARPGFTAAPFYFQIARAPNNWSTYTVIAPRGTGMGVDAHNMEAGQPELRGDEEVFFHEERRVRPLIPEPDGPPSSNEMLPFVSVGAGATGNETLVAAYADAYLDRGQRTFEVEQFAREAAGSATGVAAIRAIYAAVMEKLPGRDAGLTVSAASSLAQGRGSRLWLLKASLEAVGIPARVVAIRTFAADPAPYRYPNASLLPYVCVRAELPGLGVVWLDSVVRFAPFGELPEQATGGQEAWLLPEPGRPLERVQPVPASSPRGKEMTVRLKLSPDGALSGTGEELYDGFDAAQLAESLDAVSPEQRKQAVQGALARFFGGAELSSLELDIRREVGAPLRLQYSFVAPRFGRVEGNRLVLGPLTFPTQLGKRYGQLGTRRTPLYIGGTERSHIVVELELPPGFALASPVPEVQLQSRYGSFLHREAQEDGKLRLEESYRLDRARISPQEYDDFVHFAGEMDLIQSRDLVFERR